MANVKSYRDLQVWKRSVDISVMLYGITDGFPQSELYGLTAQMRRASVSIASNIAEGFGRSGRELARYSQLALGSLAEVETQTEIAHRVGYLSEISRDELDRELTILGKQLNVLLQRVSSAD